MNGCAEPATPLSWGILPQTGGFASPPRDGFALVGAVSLMRKMILPGASRHNGREVGLSYLARRIQRMQFDKVGVDYD